MTISRRGFLKLMAGAGVAGAAATVGVSQPQAAEHEFYGNPDRFGVLFDSSRCIGCRSCEAACNATHDLPKPPAQPFDDPKVLNEKRRLDQSRFTLVNKFTKEETGGAETFVKIQCMHCDEPACFSACLAKAFTKTPEGPVVYNSKQCIGCRYCMQACPFYVPTYEYQKAFTPRVRKCTMCHERIIQGGIPACVETCPQEALIFGKRADLIKIARRRIDDEKAGYVDHIYGEQEVGGTCWMYITKTPFEKLQFRMDVGITPMPKLTYGYLATIPVLHTGLPILLAGFYVITKNMNLKKKEQGGHQ